MKFVVRGVIRCELEEAGRLADHGLRDGVLGDADDGGVAARAAAAGVRQSPESSDLGR